MPVDALNRRVRHARPDPRVRRLILTEADYLLFEAIDRHGPLPSNYLFEFARHVRRDRTHHQNRLTEFYNGDSRGSLLVRPQQQFAAYSARYQHVVYDLAPRARLLLAERGYSNLQHRTDPFVHRFMVACVGASFELTAHAMGLRYIPFREILTHPACGAAQGVTHPLALPLPGQTALIPDALFGLEYPGVGFRFFAVECDRNTESIERRNLRQSAFARKLAGYGSALEGQLYRSWWGVPNLHVLAVTTNTAHLNNILGAVRRIANPHLHGAFAIAMANTFGMDWRVPSRPLSFLLDTPWQTVTGDKSFATA